MDRPARELAAGVRWIAPSASGFHRQRVFALNGFSCSGREGRRISLEHRGRCQPNQPGEDKGYDQKELVDTHVFIHTRFLAGVNFAHTGRNGCVARVIRDSVRARARLLTHFPGPQIHRCT